MGLALRTLLGRLLTGWPQAGVPPFAVAEQALPVFSTEAAASQGTPCDQIRALEFVALPGTAFRVLRAAGDRHTGPLEVSTCDYPTPRGVRLYVSRSGLQARPAPPPPRPRTFPGRDAVLESLRSALGTPYVWGGNLRGGVRVGEVQGAYAGLDCSGLLYEATGGFTPRNTSDLTHYGKAVPIKGLDRDQIIARLEPLDLIAWKGHVIIVLDRETVIESRRLCRAPGQGGVRATPARERLEEVMAQRSPAGTWPAHGKAAPLFVVRRWLD
ncbi:MAG: hypothetical protein H6Q00_513 [Holophagaceae bacterium]|nr:hypothetical protein [Holophagaceae bacterium]